MTHDGLWNELKLGEQITKLKKKIKDIKEIEKSHKEMNAKLHQELDLEKKNHAITREDVQLKDMEIGRLMKKIRN